MTELKSHDLVDIQDYRGEVYLKREADEVIEELKAKIADLTATSVEFLVDPKHKGSSHAEAMNKLLHELWRQISEKVEKDLPAGSFVRITVAWDVDVDIREIER